MTKKSKYKNKKVNGFDSKKEATRFYVLAEKFKKGEISHLETQVVFPIKVNNQLICKYIADFVYYDLASNQVVVEDVKSKFTAKLPLYRLKKKLMKIINNIEITEVIK